MDKWESYLSGREYRIVGGLLRMCVLPSYKEWRASVENQDQEELWYGKYATQEQARGEAIEAARRLLRIALNELDSEQ